MQEKEQIKFEILRNSISAERERSSAAAEVKRTGDKRVKNKVDFWAHLYKGS